MGAWALFGVCAGGQMWGCGAGVSWREIQFSGGYVVWGVGRGPVFGLGPADRGCAVLEVGGRCVGIFN